ncbi:MAG: ABC transporter ATP-binding protein [Thaumarchaeota archaeon]|nr:ABC transporter ATP-binding protein [Nitrososphaerota archaeon]
MSLATLSSTAFAAELIDISKTYRIGAMEVHALNHVDIAIKKGELLALVGPSGSGKSTLLNILGTLDRPTEGSVLIDGIDTSKMRDNDLSALRNQKIGFIFQSFNLVNRTTVLRNVELPAIVKGVSQEQRRQKAEELITLMGLQGTANRKPTTLSGGQQQRIAIARALINDPAIILADEPTGNVDSKTGLEIFDILKSLTRKYGATVVVVTHNLELADMADKIVRIRDGKVEEVGSGSAS